MLVIEFVAAIHTPNGCPEYCNRLTPIRRNVNVIFLKPFPISVMLDTNTPSAATNVNTDTSICISGVNRFSAAKSTMAALQKSDTLYTSFMFYKITQEKRGASFENRENHVKHKDTKGSKEFTKVIL
jgi:hypothetical protein